MNEENESIGNTNWQWAPESGGLAGAVSTTGYMQLLPATPKKPIIFIEKDSADVEEVQKQVGDAYVVVAVEVPFAKSITDVVQVVY